MTQHFAFPAPARLDGQTLTDELATASIVVADPRGITLADGTLTVPVPDTADPAVVAQVVAAHTGAPSAAHQAETARTSDASNALGQLITLAGGTAQVRTKLKAVLAGTDTLTNQQAQRLLAAVALYAIRDRADT